MLQGEKKVKKQLSLIRNHVQRISISKQMESLGIKTASIAIEPNFIRDTYMHQRTMEIYTKHQKFQANI